MTGLEIGALAGLTAKLIGVGIDALKAREDTGWTADDAKALQSVLDAVPALGGVLKRDVGKTQPFRAYVELVTIAFGEAWRRHWLYDERLAPKESQRTWKTWLKRRSVKERIAQVEDRMREAKLDATFAAPLPGEGDALQDLNLHESVKNPLGSPWYAALWKAFSRQTDGTDDPPLLVLAGDGKSQREFERHFRLAFREGLTTTFGRPIVEWQQGLSEERPLLVRELLAARLSALRTEHLFGARTESSDLPYLPLESQYVEPDAQVVKDRQRSKPEPVIGLVESILRDSNTHIIVVVAHFGRGKSLTARTLAYRFAERFLESAETPTPARDYPIFIRCQESLVLRSLDADTAVRHGQKRIAESFLTSADINDDAFGLPSSQKTLVILDGLDEVQLSARDTVDLFTDLLGRSNHERRFVVFSRPAAVPRDVRRLDKLVVVELQDFYVHAASNRVSHVQQWLDSWSEVFNGPTPTLQEIENRALLELCAVPVLLFMIAQTWERIQDRGQVTETDVYNEFILLTARSKLAHDARYHPVVEKAAEELREALVRSATLAKEALPELGIIELLSRIAWKAHGLAQLSEPRTLTIHDVKTLVRELSLSADSLELVERGILLTLSVSLSDGEPEIHFAHQSFREFLVAKYWEARLARMVDARPKDQRRIETQLYGARLIVGSDNSYQFLVNLCRSWGAPRREQLVEWASDAVNDEALSADADTLRHDQRHNLREAALGLATALSEGPITLDNPLTLATLIAPFQAQGRWANLQAPGIVATNAILPWTQLSFARLQASNLAGANLQGAQLIGAQLVHANLEGANLEGANLTSVNLEAANLSGANLIRANLEDAFLVDATLAGATLHRANLVDAFLQGANLEDADLSTANLEGAHLPAVQLRGANLEGANLERANLKTAHLDEANLQDATYTSDTIFPGSFSPEQHRMVRVEYTERRD